MFSLLFLSTRLPAQPAVDADTSKCPGEETWDLLLTETVNFLKERVVSKDFIKKIEYLGYFRCKDTRIYAKALSILTEHGIECQMVEEWNLIVYSYPHEPSILVYITATTTNGIHYAALYDWNTEREYFLGAMKSNYFERMVRLMLSCLSAEEYDIDRGFYPTSDPYNYLLFAKIRAEKIVEIQIIPRLYFLELGPLVVLERSLRAKNN